MVLWAAIWQLQLLGYPSKSNVLCLLPFNHCSKNGVFSLSSETERLLSPGYWHRNRCCSSGCERGHGKYALIAAEYWRCIRTGDARARACVCRLTRIWIGIRHPESHPDLALRIQEQTRSSVGVYLQLPFVSQPGVSFATRRVACAYDLFKENRRWRSLSNVLGLGAAFLLEGVLFSAFGATHPGTRESRDNGFTRCIWPASGHLCNFWVDIYHFLLLPRSAPSVNPECWTQVTPNWIWVDMRRRDQKHSKRKKLDLLESLVGIFLTRCCVSGIGKRRSRLRFQSCTR